jgi:ATPase subunit of ABC transporter with duplicated ATPase domains
MIKAAGTRGFRFFGLRRFSMQRAFLHLRSVFFSHDPSHPLFDDLSLSFPEGWTGIVGANGAGKTTLLMLAVGALEAQRGHIERPGEALYCPQRTDSAPTALEDFLKSSDGEACRLRGILRAGSDWACRWDSLSHGERKRAQIAVMLWRRPGILAVDEPTNHIDTHARRLLTEALQGFRGIGLLVSHDELFLKELTTIRWAIGETPDTGGFTLRITS